MNRYPLWKYLLMVLALALGLLYTLPNLYGESPAVQISSARSTVKVDTALMSRIEQLVAQQKLPADGVFLEGNSIKVRFKDTDMQLKGKDAIQAALGEGYIVALNLLPSSPAWLSRIAARPMFLGLDLRGGVHFLLEVDMKAAVDKKFERLAGEARRELRDQKVRYGSIKRNGDKLEVQLRDAETVAAARKVLDKLYPGYQLSDSSETGAYKVTVVLPLQELQRIQSEAVGQNIATLHNRVNELGVAEPIIQQQGAERIVVQLPGVQDTAKAKDILGRTATLEVRLVEDDPGKVQEALAGNVPLGYQLLDEAGANGRIGKILVRREVELTGENINGAQAGYTENSEPAVHIDLDSIGAGIFKQVTRDNVGKRMAMILVEKGRAEVVTAPVIRQEIGGGKVQISGAMNVSEANDTALLLRAGALAAPMTIVEERTVGPSLGKENIAKGFNSTLFGFAAIAVFMAVYYRVFGLISAAALATNVLLLLAFLSMLQVTLTLPGIAAIALTLGMAIDSNVLINERIREELRNGVSPQAAIKSGYEHAWATILDSNITTLIAGVALLIFGSGAVRGFAWVHCLGIITSMFSSVFVSRGFVSLVYGYRHRLQKVAV